MLQYYYLKYMFNNYLALPEDLKTIEEGIFSVWGKELKHIFKDKKVLNKTHIASYDSKFLYLWSKKIYKEHLTAKLRNGYNFYKFHHCLQISKLDQLGWRANLPEKFIKALPKNFTNKNNSLCFISGGLMHPFIKLQKKKNVKNNPYTTKQSYLATIVHEFAHIYYNSQPVSNRNNFANKEYLRATIKLYKNRTSNKIPTFKIHRSYAFEAFTELFAFCAEYNSATILWPSFKKKLDKFAVCYLTKIKDQPAFLSSRDPHTFALVVGKIMTSLNPVAWPQLILDY